MIDNHVFRLTPDTTLPPNKITSELNSLRVAINKKYYLSFTPEQKDFFHYFIWDILHGLWLKHPSSTVRISASTTVGQILVKLAPFFADDLIKSLRDAIEKFSEESFLYLSSFCYLAKFIPAPKLTNYLIATPILHLFGPNDSEFLPNLAVEIKQCLNFSQEFVHTVVELMLQLTSKHSTNRHFPKAASILIGDDIDSYWSLITEDISLLLLESFFPKRLPNFPDDQNSIIKVIKDRAIESIKDPNSQLAIYESSCKILHKLINSNQFENLSNEITENITEEMVINSKSPNSLFLLPIGHDIISKLYTVNTIDDSNIPLIGVSSVADSNLLSGTNLNLTSTNSNLPTSSAFSFNTSPNIGQLPPGLDQSSNLLNSNPSADNLILQPSYSGNIQTVNIIKITVECDSSYVIPLMINFSSSLTNIRYFQDPLIFFIANNLNVASDAYSSALETLSMISNHIPETVLNDLILKAIITAHGSNNWIHSWWTLRMLGKISFMNLLPRISDRAFDLIGDAVISVSEKMRQTAKKVSLKIIDNCKQEVFKLFIDKFCRKFDMFNQEIFEYRVSYLAHIFSNVPQTWTISYIHIATLLSEAVGLIKFSMNVLTDIFTIIGILSQHLEEHLVLLFANQALRIIEPSYREFVGENIGLSQSPVLNRDISNINNLIFQTTKNYSSNTLINNLINYAGTGISDNSINYIKNIGKVVIASNIDTDLTSNPGLWHNQPLKYADSAFSMLSKVQWSQFKLSVEDIDFFICLANRLLELFPDYSNSLVSSIVEATNIFFTTLKNYINRSILISMQHSNSLLSFCKVVSISSERFGHKKDDQNSNITNCIRSDDFHSIEFAQALTLVFPLMHDLDFLLVLSVQRYMSLLGQEMPIETCLNVVKKNQRYLISENGDKGDSQLNVGQEIDIDPSLLYQENEDDINQPNNESKIAYRQHRKSKCFQPLKLGLLKYCSSLTPFYYLHLPIPAEMLTVPIILSFASFSTIKITNDEANKLLDVTLKNTNSRCLFYLLKYFVRMKIDIDITPCLSNPLFNDRNSLIAVLSLLKEKKLPNEYISNVLNTDDLLSFVLNASTNLNKRMSVAIMNFDPGYFIQNLLQLKKIKYKQLANLVMYSSFVRFPPGDFFTFAVTIKSMCLHSRRKYNLSRRLLTVFIASNKTNTDIVTNANNLLTCEVIPLEISQIYQQYSASQIIEYYFEIATISKKMNCTPVVEKLCHVLSKSTIYGASLNMIINPQITLDNIQSMVQSPFASLETLPFHFYGDKLKYDLNLTDITPQIIDNMFQANVIRTASTATTILSFLLYFFTNQNLTALQKAHLQQAFSFMHRNVDISPRCAALVPVLQLYKTFLPFLNSKTAMLPTVLSFADKLFEYQVIPNTSILILNIASFLMNDPTHVAMILTPYLRMKDSYSMYMVCENAATYLLRTKMESSNESKFLRRSSSGLISTNQSNSSLQLSASKETNSQNVSEEETGSNLNQSTSSTINKSQSQHFLSQSSTSDLVDDVNDAVQIVQIARSFYATFNAIVFAERMKPGLKHDLMKGLFDPIYDYSLNLLEDQNIKIFSPVFALLDGKDEEPNELYEYLKVIKDIVAKRGEA